MSGAVEYDAAAQRHKPVDSTALEAELLRLHRGGLTAGDLALALRLDLVYVLEVLARLNAGGPLAAGEGERP